MVGFGLVGLGLFWLGLVWLGLVWFGLVFLGGFLGGEIFCFGLFVCWGFFGEHLKKSCIFKHS